MWEKGWRERTWQQLNQEWDLIVIGGGITGAGVFRRAVAEGFKVLLVESGDFASGTSSRSSKLVHGGFRYLRNRQFDVTRESVREREWMLREAKNLVTPLGFLMPCYKDKHVNSQFAIGVVIYDLLAPKWQHSRFSANRIRRECPQLDSPELSGGYLYYDAEMDDAHLVLHLLRAGVRAGGTAMNYAKVVSLLKDHSQNVCGVALCDQVSGKTLEIKSRTVINAAGPWSDELRAQVGAPARLRKLRGSHLIFSREQLPLTHAVTLLHPRDHRAMFAIPWEGATIVGTTDLDHRIPLEASEPFCTQEEIQYILESANATFPSIELTAADIISSFAGLRPVINTGNPDPSKESRAHVVWEEKGLITVTGGKLTTFRIMAEQALQKAAPSLARSPDFSIRKQYFEPLPTTTLDISIPAADRTYLLGRYGIETSDLLHSADANENSHIANLPNYWSELRWAARTGGVEHLDDLLLRRVRLGMLLPDGASSEMIRIRSIAQPELGWGDDRWQMEEERYREIYNSAYAPQPTGKIKQKSQESPECPQDQSAHPSGMKTESQTVPTALS